MLKASGIRILESKIAQPDLGLPQEQYRALTASVRSIVHCAADIRFNISLEESRSVNVRGTAHLLEFARQCLRLEKFAHASTVHVWGGKRGHLGEVEARPGQFFNPYQQSKFEAEQLILAAMRSVPVSIYRFSTMVFDGEAQRVRQFNYFHQLLRLALHNPLHMIPADGEAKVDLILSDWASRVFCFLFEEQFQAGEIVHIAAGGEGSLSVRELLDWTFACLPVTGVRPQLVTQERFDRLAASILTTASRRHMWCRLSRFLPHMNLRQSFATDTLHERAAGRRDLERPDMRAMFPGILDYCAGSHWGAREYDGDLEELESAKPV